MSFGIQFTLNHHLYIRSPQETKLGKKIIRYSIELIEEIGFEDFTFKKLAKRMESTEASVYRYFENKHLLLLYLEAWYWQWVSYLIDFNTMNVEDAKKKLKIVINHFINPSHPNINIDYIDGVKLRKIVIDEGSKAYHTKSVDEENKEGLFLQYKSLIKKVADIILEINPEFPYPRALASNLFEMANNQIYFAQHIPKLTDIKIKKQNLDPLQEMMSFFAFKLLEK